MRIFSALLLSLTAALVAGVPAPSVAPPAPSKVMPTPSDSQAPKETELNPACTPPNPIPELRPADLRNIGMLVFDRFDLIDVFGTLDPLFYLAFSTELHLHMIGETMAINENIAPVPPARSRFLPPITATHTYDEAPPLDVLIVPGGPGSHDPSDATVEFVKNTYPKVKLLITICSGAQIAARAGVLDGRMATTNKKGWEDIVKDGPGVKWVAPARYVLDGNTWSSSGVTSGMDLMYEFVRIYFGADKADGIMGAIEHVPVSQFSDPFADMFNRSTEVVPCRIEFKSACDVPAGDKDKGRKEAADKPAATEVTKQTESTDRSVATDEPTETKPANETPAPVETPAAEPKGDKASEKTQEPNKKSKEGQEPSENSVMLGKRSPRQTPMPLRSPWMPNP